MPDSWAPVCASWCYGHPVLRISSAHSGSESQWNHTGGYHLSVNSLCRSSRDWVTLFSKCNACSVAFSQLAQSSWVSFLVSWRVWDSATSLVLQLHQFLSVFSLLMTLLKKILGSVLHSPTIGVKAARHGQVDGGGLELQSGGWWGPPSPGGRSGTPARGPRSWWQVAEEGPPGCCGEVLQRRFDPSSVKPCWSRTPLWLSVKDVWPGASGQSTSGNFTNMFLVPTRLQAPLVRLERIVAKMLH